MSAGPMHPPAHQGTEGTWSPRIQGESGAPRRPHAEQGSSQGGSCPCYLPLAPKLVGKGALVHLPGCSQEPPPAICHPPWLLLPRPQLKSLGTTGLLPPAALVGRRGAADAAPFTHLAARRHGGVRTRAPLRGQAGVGSGAALR